MKPIIVIEHLEPKLWPWCKIEYASISKLVQKSNLWFTNIKSDLFLKGLGKCYKKSVRDLNLENVCVLDPDARNSLTPAAAKKFNYFIIGGILGDYPPRNRTKNELTKFILGAETRNLGRGQLSTDNAVFVLKKILDGFYLSNLKFQDGAVIKINKVESIELPYYYPLINGKPRMSKKLVDYLKKKRTF